MRGSCSPWTLYTVKKTFKAACKAKSQLLVQVKENQPSLLQKIRDVAQTSSPLSHYQTTDRGKRNRSETRSVEVYDAVVAVEKTDWSGLVTRIIRVERTTLTRRAKDGLWDDREEVSFYICSANISAKKACEAIRGHWGIENKNHYVRDVSMLEDASRIRINPGIFARARSFALNILRANGEDNIANALWCNALNFKRPLAYRFK